MHQSQEQQNIQKNQTQIINDILVQKGSEEAMLVKLLNPFNNNNN